MVVFWFQQKDVYSNHVLHKSYLDIQIRQIMCLVFLGIIKCLPGFPGPMDQCMVLVVFVVVCFLVLIFLFNLLKIRCLLFLLVLVLVELQVLMFLRIQLTCPDQRGRFHPYVAPLCISAHLKA